MTPLRPDTPDPLEGTRYRTVGALGEGAMGEVLAVEHRIMKKPYAAKLLKRAYAGIEGFEDRFLLEAQMMSQIEHPNVVRVLDVGRTPAGDSFYVMERLEGVTLTEHVQKEGPLKVREALFIARRIASALLTVHGKGVVHRDLKPDNVFIVTAPDAPIGKVKLLDFGVAKVISTKGGVRAPALPTTQSMVGSPRFMAPELVLGHPADEKSDVYSLGLLLHFMLRGELPFSNVVGMVELCRAQVEDELDWLDPFVVSIPVHQAVRVATLKDPERRYGMTAFDEMLRLAEVQRPVGPGLDARLPPGGGPRTLEEGRAALPARVATRGGAPFQWRLFAVAFMAGSLLLLLGMLVRLSFRPTEIGPIEIDRRSAPLGDALGAGRERAP